MDGKFCSARAREVDKMGRSKKEGKRQRHREVRKVCRAEGRKEARKEEFLLA